MSLSRLKSTICSRKSRDSRAAWHEVRYEKEKTLAKVLRAVLIRNSHDFALSSDSRFKCRELRILLPDGSEHYQRLSQRSYVLGHGRSNSCCHRFAQSRPKHNYYDGKLSGLSGFDRRGLCAL